MVNCCRKYGSDSSKNVIKTVAPAFIWFHPFISHAFINISLAHISLQSKRYTPTDSSYLKHIVIILYTWSTPNEISSYLQQHGSIIGWNMFTILTYWSNHAIRTSIMEFDRKYELWNLIILINFFYKHNGIEACYPINKFPQKRNQVFLETKHPNIFVTKQENYLLMYYIQWHLLSSAEPTWDHHQDGGDSPKWPHVGSSHQWNKEL